MKPFLVSLFQALLFASCAQTPVATNPWREITEPITGSPQVYGGYASGCLSGAVSLYPNAPGVQVMRLSRRRFYGHPLLVDWITRLGKQVANAKYGSLLIGDMAQPRGGPLFPGRLAAGETSE